MEIHLRLNEEEINKLKELKQYYKSIFGDQTNVWIIKQSLFQEWLRNIEIPRHNKTTG